MIHHIINLGNLAEIVSCKGHNVRNIFNANINSVHLQMFDVTWSNNTKIMIGSCMVHKTVNLDVILLGGIDVSEDSNTISVIDMRSRKDVSISKNFICRILIISKNHPHSTCQSSLLALVHSGIHPSEADQDLSLCLFGIKCSSFAQQTAWQLQNLHIIANYREYEIRIPNKLNCSILTHFQLMH